MEKVIPDHFSHVCSCTVTDTELLIRCVCEEFTEFLVEKNRAYGDSANNTIHIAGRTYTPEDSIYVRMGDKIRRLTNGSEYAGDDTLRDLAGYYILLEVISRKRRASE